MKVAEEAVARVVVCVVTFRVAIDVYARDDVAVAVIGVGASLGTDGKIRPSITVGVQRSLFEF